MGRRERGYGVLSSPPSAARRETVAAKEFGVAHSLVYCRNI